MDESWRLAERPRGRTSEAPRIRPDHLGSAEHRRCQRTLPFDGSTLVEVQLIVASSAANIMSWSINLGPSLARISGAQVHDSRLLIPLVEAIAAVKGLSDRARKRPGNRAYASRSQRAWPRYRGIAARIARYGVESRERLGRWRWVVERTRAWLHQFRRVRIRYVRRADIHRAFL
jgi:hypothetical protein